MDRVKKLQRRLDEAREGKVQEMQTKARKYVLESYDKSEANLLDEIKSLQRGIEPVRSQLRAELSKSGSPPTAAFFSAQGTTKVACAAATCRLCVMP